jgi:hypothetical protein
MEVILNKCKNNKIETFKCIKKTGNVFLNLNKCLHNKKYT